MPNIFGVRLNLVEYERSRRRQTRSTSDAVVCRSVPILVKARVHFIRRTDRPNRDHADRVGRKEKVDQPIALFARAELLHAAARPRSATTRDLHRLALTQNPRRNCRWRAVRDSIDLCSLDAELYIRGFWQSAVD